MLNDKLLAAHQQFLKFAQKNCQPQKHINGKDGYAVLVTPWASPVMPYFNLALCMVLQGLGYCPQIIFDDLAFNLVPNCSSKVNDLILQAIDATSIDKVVRISELHDVNLDAEFVSAAKEYSRSATIAQVHSSVPSEKSFIAEKKLLAHFLSVAAPKIKALFECNSFDVLITPGSVGGHVGLFKHAAERSGVRMPTIGSGYTTLRTSTHGYASHLNDIPRVVEMLTKEGVSWDFVVEQAQEERNNRMYRKDVFKRQVVDYSTPCDDCYYDAIMFLNNEFETNSLMVENLFGGMFNWIVESADFILNNTKANIAVRQHPRRYFRSFDNDNSIDLKVFEKFSGNPRFTYFFANSKVNSYRLLESSGLVLPYVSTIGVESVFYDKPVSLPTDVYYHSLFDTNAPQTKNEYFSLIEKNLSKKVAYSEDVKQRASLMYILAQSCSFFFCDFTPQPIDFPKWINLSVEEILEHEDFRMSLATLLDDVPYPYLKFRKIKRDHLQ